MSFSDPQEKNNKISERVNEECKLKRHPFKCLKIYVSIIYRK